MSAPAPSGGESPPNARGASQFLPPPANYMSVKDAIMEQAECRRQHRMNQPQAVRLPPAWAEVHAKAAQQQSMHGSRAGPPPKVGFPRAEDGLMQPSGMTASNTSSVMEAPPGSPSGHGGSMMMGGLRSALGGSSKSGLNHTSTYFYGEAPLKPVLCTGNMYNAVGSYSMFGSQAVSDRESSGAFGFGTSTRAQLMNTYISPAHLKDCYGKFSPSPDKYTLQSSLGRQVLDSKISYPSRSFGLEERFDADRRDQRAAQTPGPGAYRV
jgi:hypothetical protein